LILIFSDNLAIVSDILTLQNKHNTLYTYIIGKYKINVHSLLNRPEKLDKDSLFYLFLKPVQVNFKCSGNVRILYIYIYSTFYKKYIIYF